MDGYSDAALDPAYALDLRSTGVMRFRRDPEPERQLRRDIRELVRTGHRQAHKPGQWGFCIVRTAYNHNENQFQRALSAIRAAVEFENFRESSAVEQMIIWAKKEWDDFPKQDWELDRATIPDHCDPRPNQELLKRFSNDIIEDREQLDGATDEQIRNFFSKWCLTLGEDPKGVSLESFPRYKACMVLDSETIALLNAIDTTDFGGLKATCSAEPPRYWVKMIERETRFLGSIHMPPQFTDSTYPVLGTFRLPIFATMNMVDYWWTRYKRGPDFHTEHYLARKKDPDPKVRYYGRNLGPSPGYELYIEPA